MEIFGGRLSVYSMVRRDVFNFVHLPQYCQPAKNFPVAAMVFAVHGHFYPDGVRAVRAAVRSAIIGPDDVSDFRGGPVYSDRRFSGKYGPVSGGGLDSQFIDQDQHFALHRHIDSYAAART